MSTDPEEHGPEAPEPAAPVAASANGPGPGLRPRQPRRSCSVSSRTS